MHQCFSILKMVYVPSNSCLYFHFIQLSVYLYLSMYSGSPLRIKITFTCYELTWYTGLFSIYSIFLLSFSLILGRPNIFCLKVYCKIPLGYEFLCVKEVITIKVLRIILLSYFEEDNVLNSLYWLVSPVSSLCDPLCGCIVCVLQCATEIKSRRQYPTEE